MSSYIDLTNETGYLGQSATVDYLTVTADASIAGSLTLSGATPSSILTVSSTGVVTSIPLTNGQLLIGRTGLTPAAATLTGTVNQINVTSASGSITLATPQDIHTAASPTFAGLSLSSTSMQLGFGPGGLDPDAGATVINVTNSGFGSRIDLNVEGDDEFVMATGVGTQFIAGPKVIADLRLQSMVFTNDGFAMDGGIFISVPYTFTTPMAWYTFSIPDIRENTDFAMCAGAQTFTGVKTFGVPPVLSVTASRLLGTTAGSAVQALECKSFTGCSGTVSGSNFYIDTPQDLQPTSGPAFAFMQITQSPIASTSLMQFSTTGGVTSLQRDDATGFSITSAPAAPLTVDDLIATGLTASMPVKTNASKKLVSSAISLTADISGVLPIASGGTNTSSALSGNRLMWSSGGAIVEATALTSGQLFIGSTGAAPVAASITGTANRVTVTPGAGSITLSGPQDLATSSSPSFASAALTATTNQIVLGSTRMVTISAPTPATASRTYTMPDPGADASFVMTEGTQTINGITSFTSAVRLWPTSDQISLGATFLTTLTVPTPAADRTYTVPDAGANASFVMTAGAQTVNGVKTFGSGILLPTSGGTASSLSYYEEYTHTTNLTGIWGATTPSSTWDVTRIGRIVICTVTTAVTATASVAGNITTVTALPSRFRPPGADTIRLWYCANDNGTLVQSRMDVKTNGNMQFFSGNGGNFAGAGTSGLFKSTFYWSL